MAPSNLRFLRLIALAVCLIGVSCTDGLYKDLDAEQGEISRETSRIASTKRSPDSLSWKKARDRMLAEDLILRQSELRLAEIVRQRKSQWREWLPRPTLYVNMQNGLQELGDFSSEQLAAAFYAPLTIPNPWSQTARAYQYALQEVQATDHLELNRRRQVITLYRLFAEWERMEDRYSSGIASTMDEEVQMALRAREDEAMANERREMYRGQFARMLNLPGVDVTPRTETLPAIDYGGKLDGLVPGKNYGQLATRLSSYEIQAAILRRKGFRFVQWPAPNFSASVPTLYDSRREDGQVIDGFEQITLFGTWSKSFDVTGRDAAGIQSAEENVHFVRESLRLKLDSEGRTWDRLKVRYRSLLEKRGLLRERLAAVLRGGASSGAADKDLDDARRLMSDLENLERAKQELDMEVWLWDDDAWK